MNLVFLTPDFPPYASGNRGLGGIGTWIHDFARGAAAAGHACTVMCYRSGIPEEASFDREAPFRVVRLSPAWMRLFRDPLVCWKTRGILPRGEEALFIAGTVPLCRVALRVKALFGVPAGVLVHGNDILRARRDPRLVQALGRLDFVAANSSWTRRVVEEVTGRREGVVTVNPFLDPDRFPGVSGEEAAEVRGRYAPGARRVLLTAGRLVERKNHALVLDTLPAVAERFPGTRYVIAGDGPFRARLEERAAALGVADLVCFAGFVSPGELEALYRAADLFVMPSRETDTDAEGFGIVFLEAGYFGLPVVGARSGGIPDAVIEGETGFLVDPESREELEEAIVRILGDDDLCRRMGEAGRAHAGRFLPANAVPAALEAFRKAVEERKR